MNDQASTDTHPLGPGHVYATIDEALHAASCLCGLDVAGATVYGTTDGLTTARINEACLASGEAYIVACAAIQRGGLTWDAPGAPYEPIYTITRCRP